MKDWLYFFLDALGRSFFYNDGSPAIGSTNIQTPVTHAPDGWQDIAVGFERDLKDHGLMRSFSFPLKAVHDSARILRELVYKGGLEQEVYLLITRAVVEMSDTVFKHYHKAWYRGRVDTTSFVDEEDYLTFKLEDGGLVKELKTNRATKYDIPLQVDGSVMVTLDGISLAQTNNFQINAIKTMGQGHLIDCGQTSYEGRAAGLAGHQVFVVPIPGNLSTSDDYLFNTSIAITGLRIKGEIKLVRPTFYFAELRSNKGQVIKLVPWNPGAGVQSQWTFDVVFNAGADEKFFLVGQSPDLQIEYAESHFTLAFESQATQSGCRCLPLALCLDLILEKITGKRGQYSSQLLTTAPYANLLITCGDALRGLDGAGLKISFNDLMEYLKVICRAGFGVENEKVVVEDLLYFYRRSGAINLGVAQNLKVTPSEDLLGNTIRIGYKTPEIDEVNGKYAFNCSHTYELSPKAEAEVKEITLVANCVTDPYAIENVRVNFDGKLTTDGQFDNEHFILNARRQDISLFPYRMQAATNAAQSHTGTAKIKMPVFSTFLSSFRSLVLQNEWMYTRAFPMTFKCVATALWTTGVQGTLRLMTEDGVVATVTATSDGVNPVTATGEAALSFNENIWVELVVTGTVSIASASLKIDALGIENWVLHREPYAEVQGLPEKAKTTLFNVELLTPKRLLKLHRPWLNSLFFKMWDRQAKYRFLTTERNRNLYTRLVPGGAVPDIIHDEDADEDVTSEIIFKPWYFEFEVSAPEDLVDIMQVNPYRPYVFTWNDKPFLGYLVRGGVAPDDNKPVVFRLLCTPDTDLLPLLNN